VRSLLDRDFVVMVLLLEFPHHRRQRLLDVVTWSERFWVACVRESVACVDGREEICFDDSADLQKCPKFFEILFKSCAMGKASKDKV